MSARDDSHGSPHRTPTRIFAWALAALALGVELCGCELPPVEDDEGVFDSGLAHDTRYEGVDVARRADTTESGDPGSFDTGTVNGDAFDASFLRDAWHDSSASDAGPALSDAPPAIDAAEDGGSDAGPAEPGRWVSMAAPPPELIGRWVHTAVWTGSRVVVFGGENSFAGVTRLATGAVYDPALDGWRMISSVGARARARHTAVWTGTVMIVFGGRTSDADSAGESYDPATDSWSSITSVGAPPPRYAGHSAVWTGTETIVWGGATSSGIRYGTGARYDPGLDRWAPTSTIGAPSARSAHVAVWTGSEMIVWGGASPSTLGDGGAYDPTTDTWRGISMLDAPSPRAGARAVWTGSRMVVWGGGTGADLGGVERQDGATYDPVLDVWVRFSAPEVDSVKSNTAVWTGTDLVVWGGTRGGSPERYFDEGASLSPLTLRFTALPLAGAPSARWGHAAVWTGREMVIWGGHQGSYVDTTGARYLP